MSGFAKKTVGSVNNFLSNVGLFGNNEGSTSGKLSSLWNVDKNAFIIKLKSAKSKRDEEDIISTFYTSIEKRLSQPDLSNAEVETYVQLSMLCELLGYPAPFVYVHAIKLAQKGNLHQKYTGYLATAYFLHPQHELVILLINTIQKDLESTNYAEIMLGLKSVCNLINAETVHNVLHLVENKLNHEKPVVRELAALTLDHCLRLAKSQSSYQMVLPKLEKAVTDPDFGVVSSVITTLYSLVKNTSGDYGYLINSLINLQNQLLQGRVPDSEYRKIPAPWLQIKILKFFSLLCKDSQQSQMVFPVLKITLQKAEGESCDIAYGIIFEFILTVVTIKYDDEMIQLALSAASKLLRSANGNLKYMGVEALVKVVQKLKPNLTPAHQESIMECLNHPDETLKLKTLELLCYLANPANAQPVCKRIIEFMSSKKDDHIRKNLALKILQIANKYNVDNKWYISIINSVLMEAGELIPSENVVEIINIIEKDDTSALKTVAKNIYLDMCKRTHPPPCIIKIIASVLSEPSEFQDILPQFLQDEDEVLSAWLLVSLQNVILKTKTFPTELCGILKNMKYESKILQQLCAELLNLFECIQDIKQVLIVNQIDPTLSFLDDFVCQALQSGSSCYQSQSLRTAAQFLEPNTSDFDFPNLSLTSSEHSFPLDAGKISSEKSASYSCLSSPSFSTQSFSLINEVNHNSIRVKNIWTEEGRCKEENTKGSLNNYTEITDKKDSKSSQESLFAGVS